MKKYFGGEVSFFTWTSQIWWQIIYFGGNMYHFGGKVYILVVECSVWWWHVHFGGGVKVRVVGRLMALFGKPAPSLSQLGGGVSILAVISHFGGRNNHFGGP